MRVYLFDTGRRSIGPSAIRVPVVSKLPHEPRMAMKQRASVVAICISVIARSSNVSGSMQATQIARGNAILRRAAAAIMKVEPAWRFSAGVCDCNPVLDEIEAVVGTWEQSNAGVIVRLHTSKTVDSASRWTNQAARDRLLRLPDWTVAKYELADGAYLGTSRNGERYDLTFRKGRVIAIVASKRKSDIERFARYILAAISEVE